ncbi:MAG: hypothetical protein CVV64_17790 [Candidatus Wallbacteria bacterium HGW-Wallbacteria-1]|jgi:uncharacterized membrane protein YfcA|uniref:Probable membrane transporter protein n=1 Tax=Candidatus Wallbacteria bacterium HGW-Wallbacteria-1 TaxID=2013854 RepID=A0A2N1PK31_9BACT|nr:MAG: hypothetical protein CVV64_17790 [Candidatus Wallbacteria bacterium HGW-Wallbacteria-1]
MLLIAFGLGILAGGIGGYAGIGGAPLIVLGLTIAGVPQHLAQGTVLASLLGPISLPACLHLRRSLRPILIPTAVATICYAIASYFGGFLAFQLQNRTLSAIFSVFLVILGLSMALKDRDKAENCKAEDCETKANSADYSDPEIRETESIKSDSLPKLWKVSLASTITGMAGGLLGIGAGVLMVPMLLWMGTEKQTARAMCLGMLLPPVTAGAVLKYWSMNSVHWPMALAIFTGYLIANLQGARAGSKHCGKTFLLLLGLILALCGGAGIITILLTK